MLKNSLEKPSNSFKISTNTYSSIIVYSPLSITSSEFTKFSVYIKPFDSFNLLRYSTISLILILQTSIY